MSECDREVSLMRMLRTNTFRCGMKKKFIAGVTTQQYKYYRACLPKKLSLTVVLLTGGVRFKFRSEYELPELFMPSTIIDCGPGSSVGLVTAYGLDGPGIESRLAEIFRTSRPELEPTQPPVQWVPGLSRGLSTAGGCC